MPAQRCPECGEDLAKLTAEGVLGHSRNHWPDNIERRSEHEEARKRQRVLRDIRAAKVADEMKIHLDRVAKGQVPDEDDD